MSVNPDTRTMARYAESDTRDMAYSQEWTVAATEPALTEAWTVAAPTVVLEQPVRRHTWAWMILLFGLAAAAFCVAMGIAGMGNHPVGRVLAAAAAAILFIAAITAPLTLGWAAVKSQPADPYAAEVLQRVYAQRAAVTQGEMSSRMAARQPATLLPKWTTL